MSMTKESETRRDIHFSRACNFRQLGGLPTPDGRTVREGVFYRSGALADVLATPEDRERFAALGIRTVMDLRSSMERQAKPDPELPGVEVFACNGMWNEDGTEMNFDPEDLESHAELIRNLAAGQDDFDETYARMPFSNPAYRELFCRIERDETPMLVHCTAGKDRTGVACLLILLALGVARETAVADYMETNRCRAPLIAKSMERYAHLLDQTPSSREMFLSLEGVIRYNIEATLRAIEGRFDRYEDYFAAEYGLDADRLARLRERYLR